MIAYKGYTELFIRIATTIIIFLLLYVFFTTVFKWFLPFIIAYIIAYVTNPIVNYLENHLKIPRKIASLIVILFFLIFIGLVVFFLVYRAILEITRLSSVFPEIINNITSLYNEIFLKGISLYDNLPIEIEEIVDSLVKNLLNGVNKLLISLTETATKFVYGIAKSLPSNLIFIIVLFLSTYFISSDKRKISKYAIKQLPNQLLSRIMVVKNDLTYALFGYIKAQLILVGITFIEISIGMIIIGVDYPVTIALLISIIDALPILGTGIILIPWALFSLLLGNFTLAIYLSILYVIVVLVRQMFEPKIIGSQIGLYPLVTLMSIYIGLKIFGFIGLILGPIIVLIIKSLVNSDIKSI